MPELEVKTLRSYEEVEEGDFIYLRNISIFYDEAFPFGRIEDSNGEWLLFSCPEVDGQPVRSAGHKVSDAGGTLSNYNIHAVLLIKPRSGGQLEVLAGEESLPYFSGDTANPRVIEELRAYMEKMRRIAFPEEQKTS